MVSFELGDELTCSFIFLLTKRLAISFGKPCVGIEGTDIVVNLRIFSGVEVADVNFGYIVFAGNDSTEIVATSMLKETI